MVLICILRPRSKSGPGPCSVARVLTVVPHSGAADGGLPVGAALRAARAAAPARLTAPALDTRPTLSSSHLLTILDRIFNIFGFKMVAKPVKLKYR